MAILPVEWEDSTSEKLAKQIMAYGLQPLWLKYLALEGEKSFAIVMNANTFEEATDIDYFITNVDSSKVTAQWIVETYSQRNWVEVFYREAKGWLGFKEYQVRDNKSLLRHFILVFCAYTFIL